MKTRNLNICFKQGDLLSLADTGMLNAVIHGCNCFNNMNQEFSQRIKEKYPAACDADKETEKGDEKKLGTYTFAKSNIRTTTIKNVAFYVLNAYVRYNNSDGKTDNFNYAAFEKIFTDLNNDPKVKGKIIGMSWRGFVPNADTIRLLSILERIVKNYHIWIYD